MGRHIMHAPNDLCMGLRSALRLRLVDPGVRRRYGLLRVGLRRTVHLRVPRAEPRHHGDVRDYRQRGAPRTPAGAVRPDRDARAARRARPGGRGGGQRPRRRD
jgi:hypothetical protein